MKFDYQLGMIVAGAWFILVAARDLGIFNIDSLHSAILPVLALATGVIFIVGIIYEKR